MKKTPFIDLGGGVLYEEEALAILNVKYIKYYLSTNTDKLIDLLEKLGFSNIKVTGTKLRCAREEGHNPSSIALDTETLSYCDFRRNKNGDILALLKNERELPFVEAMKTIVTIINLDGESVDSEAFEKWNTKSSYAEDLVAEVKVYTKEEFIQEFEFEESTNLRFLEDGISLETQIEFELMYENKEYLENKDKVIFVFEAEKV